MIHFSRCFFPVLCLLLIAGIVESREPSDLEQYYLELLNRARMNPGAEVTRLSSRTWGDEGTPAIADLNEGLAPGTITNTARQPLAFDLRLMDSASNYADYLLLKNQFSHTANGTPHTRMQNAGYVFTPPSASGENLATNASSGAHPLNATRVNEHHEGLFIDGDVEGRGHRINMLLPDYREVGIAIRKDVNSVSVFGPGFNEVLSVQNFANSANRRFVTGVIYHDLNSNQMYDPGETAGRLTLEVWRQGGAKVASGSTWASGGYSLNLYGVSPGTYDLIVKDSTGRSDTVAFTWSGSENVKVDLVNPLFPIPPAVLPPFRPDVLIGPSLTTLTGGNIYSPTAQRQRLNLTQRTAKSTSWYARVENDSTRSDTILTKVTRGNRYFTVKVMRRQGAKYVNVSASAFTGRNEVLAGRQSSLYRVEVTPTSAALGRKDGLLSQFRVQSRGDASKVDRADVNLINRTKKPVTKKAGKKKR